VTHGNDAADRLAAGEWARSGFRRPPNVTLMGVLEVLMWCAAAAAVISLWIWPRALDARAMEKAVTKGNRPPLAAFLAACAADRLRVCHLAETL
jgi:hypothetical protein